jgi:predicted transcriptional regulator
MDIKIIYKFKLVKNMDIMFDEEKSDLFEIIGNDARRKILRLLVLEPHYVSQLSKILNKSQPAILKHMKILEDRGIVIRKVEQASESNKGPERHFFSINKSFTIMYSLTPYNVRENVYDTDKIVQNKSIDSIKQKVEGEERISKKVSIINSEIEKINTEMFNLEQKYIDLEKQRNNLLKLTNNIIENSDELQRHEMYEARQLLRKHVCESKTCVQEISNLLNKKEIEIEKSLKQLREFIEVVPN